MKRLLATPTALVLPVGRPVGDDQGGELETVVDREGKKGEEDRMLESETEKVGERDAEEVKVGGKGVAVASPEGEWEEGTEGVSTPVRLADTDAEGVTAILCVGEGVPVPLGFNCVGVATGQAVELGVGVDWLGVCVLSRVPLGVLLTEGDPPEGQKDAEPLGEEEMHALSEALGEKEALVEELEEGGLDAEKESVVELQGESVPLGHWDTLPLGECEVDTLTEVHSEGGVEAEYNGEGEALEDCEGLPVGQGLGERDTQAEEV